MPKEPIELYDASTPEPIRIDFESNPKHHVTGPGFLTWGQRRRVTQLSDGSYDGMLDAIIKVWLPDPETSWNLAFKDPKSGSVLPMPRTEDVIDGLGIPALKAEDVAHISLKLGERFYPDIFAAGLFETGSEGNSEPPVEGLEALTEPEKKPTSRSRSAKVASETA